MEHAFGSRPAFELGMEEELFLVEPATLALSHSSSRVLPKVRPRDGAVMHDTYEALVESASPVCPDAVVGGEHLQALRDAVREAGATLIGAGLHPAGGFGDVVHVPLERYRAIADSMRGLLERTPTAAIHVHVGMPDPETAIRSCNGLREHLPLLQALAAHSPYWHGRDSGFASGRSQLFRGFPRAVIPNPFRDWEDYVEQVGEWTAAGEMPDYTFLWWDLRPHPKLGTVEVRAMDGQASLRSTVGLAALAHGLALACARENRSSKPASSGALTESSFRAGRDGLAATIWSDGALRPVPEVAAAAIELAREHTPAPDALEEVERILREGNGADRMRAAFEKGGGLPGVLEHLAAETAVRFSVASAAV